MDQTWETADCLLHNSGTLFSCSDTHIYHLSSLLPHHSFYVKGSCLVCSLWMPRKLESAVGFTVRGVWEVGMLPGRSERTDSAVALLPSWRFNSVSRKNGEQEHRRTVSDRVWNLDWEGGGHIWDVLKRSWKTVWTILHSETSPHMIRNWPDFEGHTQWTHTALWLWLRTKKTQLKIEYSDAGIAKWYARKLFPLLHRSLHCTSNIITERKKKNPRVVHYCEVL